MRLVRIICAAIALLGLTFKPAAAAEQVDLLLVLAADVSRSVDGPKYQLQREGYAAAMSDPRVLNAIKSGMLGKIAVTYVEWSGVGSQKVVIDWMKIDGAQAAQQFGDRLLETQRSFADRTSISAGIEFSVAQFPRAPFEAKKRTIDVSGDGTNNSGRDVILARDEALALGITINGIVILSERPLPWNPEHTNPPGGLANYYRNNVIGGPGAFVMEANSFNAFGQAIISKLIAEIAGVAPDTKFAWMAPH
ncbi:MAG: DUF1194 domain-containing protein [Pseudolabrys sp.]|nr:DUF1194 domain-containing protein [Pseudolabrys sp.]MBV9954600.1 DUF1194 domain-containing protein [Pseudolabrys sp.]